MILQFLTVLNPPNELEDIKPLTVGTPVYWIVIWLAILLLLAVVAYFLWPSPKPKPVQPALPRELAKTQLEAMKPKIDTDCGYDFSIEVSDVLRRFIEQQFGIRASRQTSIEFLREMTSTIRIKPPLQERLRSFLDIADPIKFGRVESGTKVSAKLFDQAWTFIEEAK